MAETADTTIESRVKKIITDKLGALDEEVILQANFSNDLGADSLDKVELIMEIEKEFSINIEDDDAEKITTVQEAIDYVESRIGTRTGI